MILVGKFGREKFADLLLQSFGEKFGQWIDQANKVIITSNNLA